MHVHRIETGRESRTFLRVSSESEAIAAVIINYASVMNIQILRENLFPKTRFPTRPLSHPSPQTVPAVDHR
jgi:hypothetical protein